MTTEVDFGDRTGFDTRVGAYCVLVENGSILLAHLNPDIFDAEEWTLPGGGVDPYETPEQAAVREVREESGFEVELTGLLAVDSFVVPAEQRLYPIERVRPLLNLRIIYQARRIGGTLRNEANGSTDYVAWVPLADLETFSRVPLVDVAVKAFNSSSNSQ